MRQVTIHEFGSTSKMKLDEVPEPELSPGEILVDVQFAGLNPLDYKMRDGSSGLCPKMSLPQSLGREFVGTVAGAAPDVDLEAKGLSVGSYVFGIRAHSDLRGCYAERVAIDADTVAPLQGEAAEDDLPYYAGLALVGLTARAAIRDARISDGDTVLLHGGSGGVGQMIIPMALQAGASHVWATGRAANAERIRELGATPIPYDGVNWREFIADATEERGVDVVVDTHYFETFLPSLDHVADGGRIVALPTLADLTPARERGIDASTPRIEPTRELLDGLAKDFADGMLPLEVSEVFPMGEVARAHRKLEAGHTRGKLILDVRA